MIENVLKKALENSYTKNELDKKRLIEVLFLAEESLRAHHLSNVEIKITRQKNALGLCSYNGETISLNLNHSLYNNIDNIKKTILHEIAHALTPGEGHRIEWQKKALEIGLSYKDINRYKT